MDEDAHLVRDDFHPGRRRPLAGFGARHTIGVSSIEPGLTSMMSFSLTR